MKKNQAIATKVNTKENSKETAKVVTLSVVDSTKKVEEVEQSLKGKTLSIPLSEIKTNPKNKFGIRDIEELADSIKENGLLHNIVVRQIADTQYKYEIISGERRYKAVELIGWTDIEAKVVEANDIDSEIMLIKANLDTRELNDMEKSENAIRLAELIKEKRKGGESFGGKKTREVIADQMQIPAAQVQKLMKISELIPEFKDMVRNGVLGLETANQYAQMSADVQLMVYKSIQEGMNYTAKEAKELKDKLQLAQDDKTKQQELINKLSGKVKDLEKEKEQAIADIQKKHDEELNKANADKQNALQELSKAKVDIEAREKAINEHTDQIRAELLKELETQKGNDTAEQQKVIDDLNQKLNEAEKSKKQIQDEKDTIEKENDEFVKKLEQEQKDLEKEYKEKLDKVKTDYKEKEINQNNIEFNMELLALSKQANQLISTLVTKVAQAKAMQGFVMTDEVKTAIANIVKFGGEVSKN